MQLPTASLRIWLRFDVYANAQGNPLGVPYMAFSS